MYLSYTADGATATLTITVTGINDDPAAVNDTGYIKEGGTLTVANSAAASSGTSTGNHTGDMTDNDTDDDASSTATITSITATTARADAQTTFSSNSETVTGAYGTLTINSDGSYSYVANSNISGLDAGDANITDVFTYIVSDGTATSTATLTINVIASQDLTARNDTGTVNEDATLTVDDGDDLTPVTAATFVRNETLLHSGYSTLETKFNNDGTKMFVLDVSGGTTEIHEYTLSTPFNVSDASFDGEDETFSVRSQHTYASGFVFNNDGTKFYVVGGNSNVSEYDISTAYDISTSSYNGNSYYLTNGSYGLSQPESLAFNSDGTKMFMVESNQVEYSNILFQPLLI